MTDQPYETTQPPSVETPHPPVHDEPDKPIPEADSQALPTFRFQSDLASEENAFGWTDLDKMTDSEKLDEILILLRAFSDQVMQITSLVEEDGIGGLMQKALTGQL